MRIEKNFNIIKSLINTGTNPAALAHNNFPTSLFPDDRFYIDNLALTIKSLYPIAKIGNRVFRIGYVDFGQIDKKELIRCAHFKSHSTSFFLIFFLFYFILQNLLCKNSLKWNTTMIMQKNSIENICIYILWYFHLIFQKKFFFAT